MSCCQCNCLATVGVRWLTSLGRQAANMCDDHASKWWSEFKNTPIGQTAIFSEPVKPQ